MPDFRPYLHAKGVALFRVPSSTLPWWGAVVTGRLGQYIGLGKPRLAAEDVMYDGQMYMKGRSWRAEAALRECTFSKGQAPRVRRASEERLVPRRKGGNASIGATVWTSPRNDTSCLGPINSPGLLGLAFYSGLGYEKWRDWISAPTGRSRGLGEDEDGEDEQSMKIKATIGNG